MPVTAFEGPGEYAVRLALEDAAGNVGPYAAPVTMRFDDTRPGTPDVSAADRWHNGGALPLDAEGERPISGIRGYRVRIGGREAIVATSLPLDDLPEGGTPVEVRAVSGAGVESTAVRTLLKLDRTAPVVGGRRRAGAGRLVARAGPARAARPRPGGAVGRAAARVVGRRRRGGGPRGRRRRRSRSRPTAGTASLTARSTARATPRRGTPCAVRVDRTPPETVAFEAPDPADPTLVRVVVADATSGVAGGRIELRRAGADWRRVPTSLEGGRLQARLDDATLRAGAYELRAVVGDVAGNEAIGTRRADGAPAAVTLPLRRRTSMSVRRSGLMLTARLTAAGSPLGGREVTVRQRLRGRTAWRTVCGRRTVVIAAASACRLRTDAAGRLHVRLPTGPSRTLRVSFPGDALLLPAHGSASVRTPARARVRATPATVAAGGSVRFTGRLLGGHVPRTGKLVELQARVGVGWRTFATVRTDRRGRFRHTHRFTAAGGGRTYSFRLRVRREAAYPFESATTRPLSVRVT